MTAILQASHLNLQVELLNRKNCFYMTAPSQGQGCTSVTLSMAQLLHENTQEKVLVIDGNKRSQTITQDNKLDEKPGFIDICNATDPAEIGDWIVPHDSLSIDLMGYGQNNALPNIMSRLDAYQFILSQLHNTYSYILLDAPAVNESSDTIALASLFDGAILVVAAESAKKEVSKSAKHLLENHGATLLGSVFNKRRYFIPQWLYDLI